MQAPFHIAFCVDNHYFRSMGATIMSIVDNNRDMRFVFHVLAFEVSQDNREKLQALERVPNVAVRLHIVNPDDFSDLKHYIAHSYYSLSIFSRLVIPALVKEETRRVLYLDADILCHGSLQELAAMDISQDIAFVVADAPITEARRCAALKLAHGRYFNAGFMDVNVEKWLAEHITEAALAELTGEGKKLRFNDQDALNIVLDGRARYIAGKYNFIYDMVYDMDRNLRRMRPLEDAVFIHFAGAVKPWAEWSGHDAREMFRKYHAMSPWAQMPLDPAPRNTREMRLQSRFLAKRGRVLASLGWYLRYLRARKR